LPCRVWGEGIQLIPHKLIGEIIECRVEESFALAWERIHQQGFTRKSVRWSGDHWRSLGHAGMTQAAEAVFESLSVWGYPPHDSLA